MLRSQSSWPPAPVSSDLLRARCFTSSASAIVRIFLYNSRGHSLANIWRRQLSHFLTSRTATLRVAFGSRNCHARYVLMLRDVNSASCSHTLGICASWSLLRHPSLPQLGRLQKPFLVVSGRAYTGPMSGLFGLAVVCCVVIVIDNARLWHWLYGAECLGTPSDPRIMEIIFVC